MDPERERLTAEAPGFHRFTCTLCADCCTGAQVVRLTSGDLRLLVARLGLPSFRALRTQGIVALVREPVGGGHFAWRPRLRFRTRPLVQCPFLVNDVGEQGYRGLCSLHPDAKPLVCRLSPLTREVVDPGSGPVSEHWTAVAPVEGCPGVGHGDVLRLEAPAELRDRLHEEIEWMRFLIAGTPACPDEASAWDLIERGTLVSSD